ncbi:MAG: glycosyltransferase family 2 protein [Thermoprotei archaeon]
MVTILPERDSVDPLISLIILNHNGLSQNRVMLTRSITDALSVSANKEVIVVDNGSTDGSLEFLKHIFHDGVKFIHLNENLGYSRGMNEGAKNASRKSKYLFFINNDVSFSDKVVKEMIGILERDKTIAIVGAAIWHRDRVFVGSMLDVRLTHHTPKKSGSPYCVTAVENFIAVRSDIFHKLGGFEPNIFQVYDEADLCIRAWLSGYRVVCHPGLIVYHRHKLPIKRSNPERVFRFMRNKYLIMIKYYDLDYLFVYFPLKILSDIWWSMFNQSWRRRRSVIMVFKSIVDATLNFQTYYKRRQVAAPLKAVKLKDLIHRGVIQR